MVRAAAAAAGTAAGPPVRRPGLPTRRELPAPSLTRSPLALTRSSFPPPPVSGRLQRDSFEYGLRAGLEHPVSRFEVGAAVPHARTLTAASREVSRQASTCRAHLDNAILGAQPFAPATNAHSARLLAAAGRADGPPAWERNYALAEEYRAAREREAAHADAEAKAAASAFRSAPSPSRAPSGAPREDGAGAPATDNAASPGGGAPPVNFGARLHADDEARRARQEARRAEAGAAQAARARATMVGGGELQLTSTGGRKARRESLPADGPDGAGGRPAGGASAEEDACARLYARALLLEGRKAERAQAAQAAELAALASPRLSAKALQLKAQEAKAARAAAGARRATLEPADARPETAAPASPAGGGETGAEFGISGFDALELEAEGGGAEGAGCAAVPASAWERLYALGERQRRCAQFKAPPTLTASPAPPPHGSPVQPLTRSPAGRAA